MAFVGDLEALVGDQTNDQTDAQLQQEGLGGRGHISGGEIRDGHANGAGHTAPETADEQRCQDAEHIAQMKSGLLGADSNVDLEEGETNVAQGGEHGGHGHGAGAGLLPVGKTTGNGGDQTQDCEDQTQGEDHFAAGGGAFGNGGAPGEDDTQYADDRHGDAGKQADKTVFVHMRSPSQMRNHFLYFHSITIWQ